jgi:hypothetical protein
LLKVPNVRPSGFAALKTWLAEMMLFAPGILWTMTVGFPRMCLVTQDYHIFCLTGEA